jgi:hypothetical protein
MTDMFKLKMQVGPHSFEAEGTEYSVRQQLEIWQQLILTMPTTGSRVAAAAGADASPPAQPATAGVNGLDRLFRDENGTLILTAAPQGEDRAGVTLLITLLGYLRLQKMQEVSGTRLMMSLKATGGMPGLQRVDKLALPFLGSGMLLRSGVRKAVRYKLTATGYAEAEKLARQIIESFPAVAV